MTRTGIKAPPATRAQITGGNKHIKESGKTLTGLSFNSHHQYNSHKHSAITHIK